jgi:hypothetical protein
MDAKLHVHCCLKLIGLLSLDTKTDDRQDGLRSLALEREMLRLHAESAAAEQLAQTFLRLRDYANTPIQTIAFTTTLIARPASRARDAARAARESPDANFFALSEYIRARACVSIVCQWAYPRPLSTPPERSLTRVATP